MRTVLNISRNLKNVSSTVFVRRNQNLKTQQLKIMHMVIIHLQQLSKVVHLAPIIIMLCMNLVRKTIFDSLYVPAVIPCLVNCFKLLIQPTQKDFVKRGAIISRLHVAVEYLSKSTSSSSVTKNQKQLPAPLSEATVKSISTLTANKRSSTVPDVTMKRFCQLMLGEHNSLSDNGYSA